MQSDSCQNEAESKLWEMTHSFIQTVRYNLLNHVNSGVKIHAIKCLQVIIFLLSKSSQVKEKVSRWMVAKVGYRRIFHFIY